MKEEDKDLNYWKENAKDAYMITPICVLRYISELEKAIENYASSAQINDGADYMLGYSDGWQECSNNKST